MKFKLGDFVRFIDEKREGYITRTIDEQMVAVTDEDGFEIPVAVANLTHVHGRQVDENTDQSISSNTKTAAEDFQSRGVYLAVANDERLNSVVHFHLINETSYQLLFALNTEKEKRFKGEYISIIPPKSAVKIYTAPLADLALWPKFHAQLIYYSAGTRTDLPKPLIFEEKFKAKDFSGAKKNVRLLKHPAWLITLDEETPLIDPEKLKESFFRAPSEQKTMLVPDKEIDLHIEKLRDDHLLLSPSEMLNIQLEHFRTNLETAVAHKMDSIIFIHGVGQGVLRNEIHKAISKHPQVKTFKDARKEKFGYGATEVIFK